MRKVQKKASGDLHEGEQILDARVVQPAGRTLGRAVVAGANHQLGLFPRALIARHQAEREAGGRQAMEDQGGLAATFPLDKCFFTLTERRVLVHPFAELSGNPKDLLATYPLGDVAGLVAQPGALVSKLTLWMADGTAVPLDVMKGGGDPNALVAAFDAAVANRS